MHDLNDQIRAYYEATTAPVDVDIGVIDEAVVTVGSAVGARGEGAVEEIPVLVAAPWVTTRWKGPRVAVAAFTVTALVFVTMLVALRLVDTDVAVLGGGDVPVVVVEADPWGLETIDFPTTQEEVTALFLAMPDEIGGLLREGDEGDVHVAVVDYQGPSGRHISFTAQPRDSRDGISPTVWLEMMTSAPEYDIVASSLDSADRIVWFSGSLVTFEEATIHMAGWGDPNSDWLFYAEAGSAVDRDAAVDAFVDAALR